MGSEILEVGAISESGVEKTNTFSVFAFSHCCLIIAGILLLGVRDSIRLKRKFPECCNVLISKLSQISSAWRNLAKYYREVGVW